MKALPPSFRLRSWGRFPLRILPPSLPLSSVNLALVFFPLFLLRFPRRRRRRRRGWGEWPGGGRSLSFLSFQTAAWRRSKVGSNSRSKPASPAIKLFENFGAPATHFLNPFRAQLLGLNPRPFFVSLKKSLRRWMALLADVKTTSPGRLGRSFPLSTRKTLSRHYSSRSSDSDCQSEGRGGERHHKALKFLPSAQKKRPLFWGKTGLQRPSFSDRVVVSLSLLILLGGEAT